MLQIVQKVARLKTRCGEATQLRDKVLEDLQNSESELSKTKELIAAGQAKLSTLDSEIAHLEAQLERKKEFDFYFNLLFSEVKAGCKRFLLFKATLKNTRGPGCSGGIF